jgi:formylglycine-generating enzyme required for sulfatase activity
MTEPFHIFICYAREDRDALESLRKKLNPLKQSGLAQIWYDGEIIGGKDWDSEIRRNLKSADLVLLLISDDFFGSDYIDRVELREALDANARQENIVVPVILHDCIWHVHPELSKLQALPDEAKPIFVDDHWKKPDYGFANVAHGVVKILKDSDTETRRGRKNSSFENAQNAQAAEQRRLEQQQAKAEADRRQRTAEAAEQKRREDETARQKGLPDMVLVKGGTFEMGEKGVSEPVHTVTLSDFEIGKYPVTQKLWQDIMGNNPSHFKGDDLPVEKVSWNDCQEFLKKLNARFPGKTYRLPTEAEWEFAARGGGSSRMTVYSGSNDLKEVGWFSENSGSQTHPVGQKKANELGLYDMSGNVWEWCNDWYGTYPSVAQNNPQGPQSGSVRVSRGGSWYVTSALARVANRVDWHPDYRFGILGFRLARTP